MKQILKILDWGMLFGIVACSLYGLFWIDTLSTSSFAKMVLSVGLVLLLWKLTNQWINGHEIRSLVESMSKNNVQPPVKYYRLDVDPDGENHHV